MTVCAAIFAAALTRADIIERFKAPVATRVNGLVEVFADCPTDMRVEFQHPIASFVAAECDRQYAFARRRTANFTEPGIVVHIGDVRTNITAVTSRVAHRHDGTSFTRVYIPAPGYADLMALRREIAKAFFRAVLEREIGDEEADRAVVDADPQARVERLYAELERWRAGGTATVEDDERMIRLSRRVIIPGVARQSDVLHFASRLFLYPASYDLPFGGMCHECTFREAVKLSRQDIRVRFAAYDKAPEVVLFGGGRGEPLALAADAYSKFLFALARGEEEKQLLDLLDDADMKLNVALEDARRNEAGGSEHEE